MRSVEFFGETFEAPERINTRRLLRFSSLANAGLDSSDTAGMAALDGLIDQCLRPEDVERFDALCDTARPDAEELMAFVAEMMQAITDRPTSRPSVSSDGPPATAPKSTGGSSSPVIADLSDRPDLQLVAMMAQESRTA